MIGQPRSEITVAAKAIKALPMQAGTQPKAIRTQPAKRTGPSCNRGKR